MKRVILLVVACALIVLAAGSYYSLSSDAAGERVPGVGVPVQLYYYDPSLDSDEEGNVMCSRAGLVPVTRVIEKSDTILADAISLLLRGELTEAERAEGITTEFPLQGVFLGSAVVEDGVATLRFDDPENLTGGGACRSGVLWFQIEATALQFPGIKSVRFEPEGLFQP